MESAILGFMPELVWSLASFAFVVCLVLVMVALIRRGASRSSTAAPASALHILEDRYARGEISRDEFLERKAVLTGSSR